MPLSQCCQLSRKFANTNKETPPQDKEPNNMVQYNLSQLHRECYRFELQEIFCAQSSPQQFDSCKIFIGHFNYNFFSSSLSIVTKIQNGLLEKDVVHHYYFFPLLKSFPTAICPQLTVYFNFKVYCIKYIVYFKAVYFNCNNATKFSLTLVGIILEGMRIGFHSRYVHVNIFSPEQFTKYINTQRKELYSQP